MCKASIVQKLQVLSYIGVLQKIAERKAKRNVLHRSWIFVSLTRYWLFLKYFLFFFQCPFSRIVFRFEYKNTELLNQLQNLVTNINARALELDDMPQHVIDAALSTYKLSA